MNSWPLLVSGATIGFAGSVHCLSMCSALQQVAIHGFAPARAGRTARQTRYPVIAIVSVDRRPDAAGGVGGSALSGLRAALGFQAGRLTGYALLGALAGLSGQWLLGAAHLTPAFHALWAMLNALLLAAGITMLCLGRQPGWVSDAAFALWQKTRRYRLAERPASVLARSRFVRGTVWALLPCGLLYSALALAVLAADPIDSALVMAAFAMGTSTGLLSLQCVLALLRSPERRRGLAGMESIAMRLSGLILVLMSGAVLWTVAVGSEHPFCG